MSEESRLNKGRGLVDRKLVEAPSNFIVGPPKAALLFWFFGNVRCGVLLFIVILVLLFIVILVIYINIQIGKNRC